MYIGARDAERGRAAAQELGAQLILLDVTDDTSVAAVEQNSAAGRAGSMCGMLSLVRRGALRHGHSPNRV
jgi:hypothetical protein